MTPISYHYAFLDASGDVSPFSGSRFLVITILAIANPRSLELHIKRAHKRYGTSLASGELKADVSQEKVVERVLRAIVDEPVTVIAVIVDKRTILRPPRDVEEIYRLAVTRAARHAVERWPRLELCLDRRYTTEGLWHRLEKAIREGIADIHQDVVLVRQEDSVQRKELQAVDYVAWALFQKYERGSDHFYRAIAARIVVEEMIEQALW